MILEHVREVRAVVDAANGAAPGGAPPGPSGGGGGDAGRRSGFQLGAYLFPPSLASLVGQDYAALAPSLDVVSPMLYRTLEGDACLASEVGALSALGLLAPRGPFTAQDVGAEVALARDALGMSPAEGGAGPRPFVRPRLVPILQLADEAVAETTAAALDAGADGVDYFAYRAGTERHVAQVAEVVATYAGTGLAVCWAPREGDGYARAPPLGAAGLQRVGTRDKASSSGRPPSPRSPRQSVLLGRPISRSRPRIGVLLGACPSGPRGGILRA